MGFTPRVLNPLPRGREGQEQQPVLPVPGSLSPPAAAHRRSSGTFLLLSFKRKRLLEVAVCCS